MVQQGEKYPLHSPSQEAESFTGLAIGLYQQHKGEKQQHSAPRALVFFSSWSTEIRLVLLCQVLSLRAPGAAGRRYKNPVA